MKLNPAAFVYLPPLRVPGAHTFMENLRKFPPAGDLVCFSDHDHDWPGLLKMRAPLESLKDAQFDEGTGSPHAGKVNPFAMHNGAFLVACKMAREQGRTHMLYLEADCRLGQAGWDQVIWDEFFNLGRVCIVAGTLSLYNGYSSGRENALRARELLSLKTRHNIPVPSYGWTWERGGFGAKDAAPPCVFPNGALAVYDLHWMTQLWNLDNLSHSARNNGPFDMAIGHKLVEMFGTQAFDVVGYLHSVYSGFGDVMTTHEERQKLLLDKKVVGIHQVKGDWAP